MLHVARLQGEGVTAYSATESVNEPTILEGNFNLKTDTIPDQAILLLIGICKKNSYVCIKWNGNNSKWTKEDSRFQEDGVDVLYFPYFFCKVQLKTLNAVHKTNIKRQKGESRQIG